MTAAPVTLTLLELSHFLSASLRACSLLPVVCSSAAAGLQPLAGSETRAHPSLTVQPASWVRSGDKHCWPLAKQWPGRSALLNRLNKRRGEKKSRLLVTISVTKCSGGNEILDYYFFKDCNCFH